MLSNSASQRLWRRPRTALGFCLELLEEVRQGKPSGVRVLPAVFEEELSGEELGEALAEPLAVPA